MSNINDELTKLKLTKEDIKLSITNKGGVLNDPSNFSTYNAAINNITDFSVIGYDSTPAAINEAIEYSKNTIMKLDFANDPNAKSWVANNKQLIYFPVVDMSEVYNNDMICFFSKSSVQIIPLLNIPDTVTTFNNCFKDCSFLQEADIHTWNINPDADITQMFLGCTALKKVVLPKISNTNLCSMFSDCPSLTSINFDAIDFSKVTDLSYFLKDTKITVLPPLNTSNCLNFENIFGNTYLYRIEGLDLSSAAGEVCLSRSGDHQCFEMTLYNLGKDISATVFNFYNFYYWGQYNVGGEKETLIASLLTNSADRTETSNCKIILNPAVYNRLTDEEKAQIEAKNYTLTDSQY